VIDPNGERFSDGENSDIVCVEFVVCWYREYRGCVFTSLYAAVTVM
jgi:hypothetical protein